MTWSTADAFFEAINVRDEREAYRLRALSRMMQDVPSRAEKLSALTSALGAFTLVSDDEQEHPTHRGRPEERAFERYSMLEAEKLRRGVKSAGAGTKHRAPRPVPAPLVAWGKALGIALG